MIEITQIIITGIFSVVVAFGTVWIKHFLDNKKKDSDEENCERISQKDIDSMIEVQEFIENFREKWKFDRIGIFQFHNGGKFFHGIPMKKYSQTFESVGYGISKSKEHNQNVFVTEHPSLMKHLSEKEFFSVDAEDPVLDYIRGKVTDEGILQIFSSPIRSLSGQLIGFIQLHTVKHKVEISDDLITEIIDLANNLSGYLIKK
ncbi:MAG: hypothetical protein EBS19_02365 [Spirochaetia bacterium]|nr:hypothetical protein [Spirochaetia bacterium]